MIRSLILPLVVGIILHLATQTQGASKELAAEMLRVGQQLFEQFHGDPKLSGSLRQVVHGKMALRSGPGRRSSVVAWVYYGDLVTLHGRRKGWGNVTYFDVRQQKVVTGWVFSRYLRRAR